MWPWNKVDLDLSMCIDSDLFLFLLESWSLDFSIFTLMLSSWSIQPVVNQFSWFMLILLSSCNLNMPVMMFFSPILFWCKILPFPYLFSFDQPRSISDLGLNCDLHAIEYGGNIGILSCWIYVFDRIEGIIWKLDIWVLLPLTWNWVLLL